MTMKLNILMLVVVAITLSSCLGGETPKEDRGDPQGDNMLHTDTTYIDITKTGPLKWSEIRNQNPLTPEDYSEIEKIGKETLSNLGKRSPRKILENSIEYGYSQYKDPVKWAQELRQAGYGESKYDDLIAPTTNVERIQENRALNQSTGEKLLNGVLNIK